MCFVEASYQWEGEVPHLFYGPNFLVEIWFKVMSFYHLNFVGPKEAS